MRIISSDRVNADRYNLIYAIFMGIFVTFVVLTNTAGVKIFTIFGLNLPVSILWYPFTFLITDIVSEMYGAKKARHLVIMGFIMSLVLLLFSLIGIGLPAADFYPLQEDYKNIFGPVWRLLFASMAAYLLAQMIDVRLFHFWKRLTGGKHLWLRNNGSTILSQLVDSLTVNFIFLYNNPAVFTGDFWDVLQLSLNVYILKVIIALIDTPFCYLGVRIVEKSTGISGKEIR